MTAGKRHKQMKILNLNDGPECRFRCIPRKKEAVFTHLLGHMFNKSQSNFDMVKTYVTFCELTSRLPFRLSFVVVQL